MSDSFFIYDNLPDQPELAFLYLEEIFYQKVMTSEKEYRGDAPNSAYVEYISQTLAAKTELQLDILRDWKRPSLRDFDHSTFLDFRHDVVHYRTAIQIRFGQRTKAFSARLDVNAKRTLHHLISQLREIVLEASLTDQKRERLLDKLAAFENEVDRDRTRFDAFAATMVQFSAALGEAIDRSRVLPLLERIANVLHGSQEAESKELPKPVDRKQIEAPKKDSPKTAGLRSLTEELDDEIPF